MLVTDSTKEQALMILDFIDNSPVEHQQASWFDIRGFDIDDYAAIRDRNICGTTMCLAGTQRFLAGGIDALAKLTTGLTAGEEKAKAGEALGLDYNEYDWLFLRSNNRTSRKALEAIAAGDKDSFRSVMAGYL